MSAPQPPPRLRWPAAMGLLQLGGDSWRVRDACEGTLVFGGTGSGKTSGSGRALALAFLEAGFGGLVLCAKKDEPELWQAYAAQSGRSADLVRFGSKEAGGFNFMRDESERPGAGAGLTENLVNLFMEVASLGSAEGGGRGDPFWERSMRSLVRNCVDLLVMAGEPVTLHAMFEVIRAAADEPAKVASPSWREASFCWDALRRARVRAAGADWEGDCREVAGYWLHQFPTLGDRTRGSIVAMFATLAEGLMRGRMRELFCSATRLSPQDVIDGGVVVVDLPVKEWSEVGRMAAVIWKYCLQKAVERRTDNAGGEGRPLFIWADECQHFTSRYDPLFQATARSSRVATVYLTQNLPALAASLGSGSAGRMLADGLLGNLGTKVFHANGDRDTNRLASDLAGRRIGTLRSDGRGTTLGLGGQASVGTSAQCGRSEHIDLEFEPMEMATLRKGGPESGFTVEALVFQNGRTWSATRRTWQKVAFAQGAGGPTSRRTRIP